MNIERIRIDLLERLEALEARSDKASRHASHRDEPLSADFEEQATESANDEVLSVIAVPIALAMTIAIAVRNLN